MDHRPFVAMVICALVLAMQEYYGGRIFFDRSIRPHLLENELAHPGRWGLTRYDELWGYGWWAFTRIFGYTFPFVLWKIFFPKDSLLDLGLRIKGFFGHAWIYALFLSVVLARHVDSFAKP